MRRSGSSRRTRALWPALACLGLLAAPSPGLAGGGELVVAKRGGGAERKQAIEDFWTDRRIARARPLELVRRDGGVALRRAEPEPVPFNHPTSFESGRVRDPLSAPNTVNGKLYGKIDGVGTYECSATSVSAGNRNTIITAGHCVAEPSNREIAKKLAFVPAYDRETRPYGTWVFDRIVVLKAWKKNSNFNYDFAGVELSPQEGVNLEDAVGGAPVATRLPVDQTYYAVGYPVNLNRGELMRYCLGEFEGYDPHPIENGPTAFAMGCDMGAGASGGGWFVNGHLNSVTSFGYPDHRDVGYGPYFGGKAEDVYEKAAG